MEFKGEEKYERCPRCGSETYPGWFPGPDPPSCIVCGYNRTGYGQFAVVQWSEDDLSQPSPGFMIQQNEFHKETKYETCPRCGNETYPACGERGLWSLLGCVACGYRGDKFARFLTELRGNWHVSSQSFSGLMFQKYKDGGGSCFTVEAESTHTAVSTFLKVLKFPHVDRNGSYLNKWDEETKTLKRFNPNRNLWH